MTDYKMTDEMRKILTEFLGECWHRATSMVTCSCGREGLFNAFIHALNMNRTFTNGTDMLAVFRAIRDKGKFNDFLLYCAEQAEKEDVIYADTVFVWLFLDNPERACCLAAMFLEERK